jgi:hypothetical protein
MEGEERLEFSKEVKINKTYEKEKNKTETPGITGNIMKSSSSPLFIAGILGFLALFLICSIKTKTQINLKRWDLKVSSYKIKGSMVFLLSLLVLSQFTHELFHIFTASVFSCKAVLNSFIPVISPASVALECSASKTQSLVILGSGIMGNIIIGLFFQLFYKKTGKKTFSILSISFLASSFLYFFHRTGDIHSIMRILGTGISQFYLDFAGLSMLGIAFYFFFIEHIQNIGTSPKYHNDM